MWTVARLDVSVLKDIVELLARTVATLRSVSYYADYAPISDSAL